MMSNARCSESFNILILFLGGETIARMLFVINMGDGSNMAFGDVVGVQQSKVNAEQDNNPLLKGNLKHEYYAKQCNSHCTYRLFEYIDVLDFKI